MNIEFGDLRSLMNNEWIMMSQVFKVMAVLYKDNPSLFWEQSLPYIEEHLFGKKEIPSSIRNSDLEIISEVVRESEVLRSIIDSISFCQNDSLSLFSSLSPISDLFKNVEFSFFDQSEEFRDNETLITRGYFPSMKSLSFSYSNNAMLPFLTSNCDLENLSVSSSYDRSYANQEGLFDTICSILENNDLRSLKLKEIRGFDLGSILPYCSSLDRLHLCGIPIGDDGASLISEADNLSNLRSLSLEGCRISDAGVEELVSVFETNLRGLESISLYGNPFHFYQGGGRALANSRLGFNVDWYHDYNDMQR